MNKRITYCLGGGFLAGFLAVGIPYWLIPYDRLSSPNTLYLAGLVVVTAAAAVARGVGRTHFLTAMLVAGTAVPAAVIARVAVEISGDPASHHLWPAEVIIALIVGIIYASMGALAGSFPEHFSRRG